MGYWLIELIECVSISVYVAGLICHPPHAEAGVGLCASAILRMRTSARGGWMQRLSPASCAEAGHLNVVVVSSPEIAKDVLQKYGQVFSSRSVPGAAMSNQHNKFSMVWLPAEDQWRKLRRICKEQMFSTLRLDASWDLRLEKLLKLGDFVNQCSVNGQAVNIGETAFITSLNLMTATLFSVEFAEFNSDSSQEFKEVVWGVMECHGTPNIADYFPVLKYLDPQGILRRSKFYFEKLFAIFDGIIDERLKSRGTSVKNDLLDALLDLNQKPDSELSRDDIKHLLLVCILFA
ncbi:unnamed protein product [Fraxinus pennsylvanica]|uniref:Cytochrome P450 n=1 Tax=Fraxinus pennsylvanica TaxID=56036 RepID=A0AAD1ZI97_9LAMI|nr:unnamed protein product [Fraxinus pennsylvanica]